MSDTPLSVSIDAASLARLEKALGPQLYRDAVAKAVGQMTLHGELEIKARTPAPGALECDRDWIRTGDLRRSIMSDVSKVDADEPEGRVVSDVTVVVYGWWIETGENRRGDKMKVRPGGYRMFADGARAAGARAAELVAAVVRDIEQRWRS